MGMEKMDFKAGGIAAVVFYLLVVTLGLDSRNVPILGGWLNIYSSTEFGAAMSDVKQGALIVAVVMGAAGLLWRVGWEKIVGKKEKSMARPQRGNLDAPKCQPQREPAAPTARRFDAAAHIRKVHAARKSSTRSKISAAIAALRQQGKPLTRAAVSSAAGVSEKTVSRHWKAGL